MGKQKQNPVRVSMHNAFYRGKAVFTKRILHVSFIYYQLFKWWNCLFFYGAIDMVGINKHGIIKCYSHPELFKTKVELFFFLLVYFNYLICFKQFDLTAEFFQSLLDSINCLYTVKFSFNIFLLWYNALTNNSSHNRLLCDILDFIYDLLESGCSSLRENPKPGGRLNPFGIELFNCFHTIIADICIK